MKHLALLTIFVCFFLGCGGGGGGGDSVVSYAGTWKGTVDLINDPCGIASDDPTMTFSHFIEQDGSAVVLTSGQMTYTGSVDENGLQTGVSTIPNSSCTGGVSYAYTQIEDESTTVIKYYDLTCAGVRCLVSYAGWGYREAE